MKKYYNFNVYSYIRRAIERPITRYLPVEKAKKCFLCPDLVHKHRILCIKCFHKYMIKSSGKHFEGMDFIRELARIRDNHKCQLCDKKWRVGQRRFDIHHLEGCGERSFKYDKIEDLNNLITYCHKCHLNLPEVLEKMENKSSERPLKQKLYQKEWEKVNKPWLK